jgi:heme/copper-type cytochrome/quinol oxidase subunit 3
MSPAAAAHHTSTGLDNRKIAFWAFIGSECLLFGSLISTYLVYEGRSISGPTTHEILNIPLTTVSTFVLLMSSLAMVLALAGVQEDNRVRARLWLGVTALLGLVFLGFQYYEFNHFVHEGLGLTTNLFGSTFFTLTGFHGGHVAVGVIWLTTLLIRSFQGNLGPEKALNVEIASRRHRCRRREADRWSRSRNGRRASSPSCSRRRGSTSTRAPVRISPSRRSSP